MQPQANDPLIPASTKLPEITFKSIVLSLILVVLLCASNAYLGLKIGNTIAASIPASVVALGILRLFKQHNILESNIVQTAASCSEALASGLVFTLPALIMMHYWTSFPYWETTFIALLGGLLGVLFSIPLRRILLADKTLRFPEGTAIGHVLRAGASTGTGLKYLAQGTGASAIIAFCQNGLYVISDHFATWWGNVNGPIFSAGIGFSPAIVAAGYIVGINVGIALFIGALIAAIAIPVISVHMDIASQYHSVKAAGEAVWAHEVRFIGVGTMLVGGLWLLLSLFKPVYLGLKHSFHALQLSRSGDRSALLRTEHDIPINYVMWGTLILAVPTYFLLSHILDADLLGISPTLIHIVCGLGIFFVIIVGFFGSAIGGYFAGLVGSSNSPVSGLTLGVLLLISFALFFAFKDQINFAVDSHKALSAGAMSIAIAAIIAVASSISIENIQDLKAGQMIGATPWKQQVMLLVGVIAGSFVIPPILELLYQAYGIGNVLPHSGMNPQSALSAPQGQLMSAITQGVFGHHLNWNMISIGAIIAAVGIVIDEVVKKRGLRLPVLAIGIGIYLPFTTTAPMILGGVISWLVRRRLDKQRKGAEDTSVMEHQQRSILLACGLVAGASLMSVFLAIPFTLYQSSEILQIMPDHLAWLANILGAMALISLCVWLYRLACSKGKE